MESDILAFPFTAIGRNAIVCAVQTGLFGVTGSQPPSRDGSIRGEGGCRKNGGLGNQEWAAVVNRDGIVCAVVFSGTDRSQECLAAALLQPRRRTPLTP